MLKELRKLVLHNRLELASRAITEEKEFPVIRQVCLQVRLALTLFNPKGFPTGFTSTSALPIHVYHEASLKRAHGI